MAGAQTTLKMDPEKHQALEVLLKYLADKVSAEEFLAVLTAQGRAVRHMKPEEVVKLMAGALLPTVQYPKPGSKPGAEEGRLERRDRDGKGKVDLQWVSTGRLWSRPS